MSVYISADVWRHSKAKGAALLVLLSLADQANDDGQCWPKVEQIAERCRISRASVHRHLDQLRELEELKWENRSAESRPNLYTITVKAPSQSETGPRRTGETSDVSTVRQQETSLEPSEDKNTPPDLIGASFEQWYAVYPRHDGKLPAEKAYRKLVKGGRGVTPVHPSVLLHGATLYRQLCERERTARKYIALPASWLNAGRWEDESLTVSAEPERTEGFGW